MNRRSFLAALGGASLLGTAGCIDGGQKHSLRFVRLNRDWFGAIEVDLRIVREGTTVHEGSYELSGIEASERGDEEPTRWAREPFRKLIQPGWDTDPARFTVESRVTGKNRWESESFEDVESTIIGASVDIVGSSVSGIRAHEFNSEEHTKQFLDAVTSPGLNLSSNTTG